MLASCYLLRRCLCIKRVWEEQAQVLSCERAVLQVISMEGFGCDAYLHLNRLGNVQEPLP